MRILRSRDVFSSLSVVTALGLIALFQNCGGSQFIASGSINLDSKIAASATAYPYSEKPMFFKDVALFAKAEQVANLSQFDVEVAAAYIADSTAPITYEVQVLTDTGATVCPRATGTLVASDSKISFNCVSAVLTTHPKVSVRLTAMGVTELSTKAF